MLRPIAWFVTVLLLVTGCSASVTDGSPTAAPSTLSPATQPPTSEPSVPIPHSSGAPTAPPVTGCPPGAVTVTGAPFCYPLPSGFTDFSGQAGYASGWKYRTLVSTTQRDLIEVLGASSGDTDQLTDEQLLGTVYPRYRLRTTTPGVVQAGTATPVRVDGARAFEQQGRYTHGVRFTAITVFFGHFVVYVSCQSQQQPVKVAAACRSVRSTIVLARP